MRKIGDCRWWIGVSLAAFGLLAAGAGAPARAETGLTEHTYTLGEGEEPGEATIADVAWLAGSWRGPAFDGDCEEVWTAPRGPGMLGMFRLTKDDRAVFFELMTLTERSGRMALQVKHFDPDLTGWESRDETVDFPLMWFTEKELFFDGLTIEKDGDDKLVMYLAMHGDEGTREEIIEYTRAGAVTD